MAPDPKKVRKAVIASKMQNEADFVLLEHIDEVEADMMQYAEDLSYQKDASIAAIDNTVQSLLKDIQQIKDLQFPTGLDGDDGDDYVLTDADKADIASKIKVPVVEKVTEIIREVESAPVDTKLIAQEAAAIAETVIIPLIHPNLSAIGIRDKLESLLDDERLDASFIKGLDDFVDKKGLNKAIEKRAIDILDKRTEFLINKTIAHDSTLTGNGTPNSPLSVVSGGGGFTALQATEVPNGVRTTFTFSTATAQPSYVVVDYAIKPAVAKNGNVNWTWNSGTKVATLQTPSQEDIFAIV